MPADGARVRVLIVDDHTLFRSGLTELLERRGIDVCAAVGDGEEGIALAATLEPDIVLLDLRMPQLDGLTVLERLTREQPGVAVAMLTTSSAERDLLDSLRAGARGYLLKDMEPEQLIDSLHEILAGGTVVASPMRGALARADGDAQASGRRERFASLTPREMEILCHVAEGRSNKAIARVLGITDGTVKLHVRAILRKLEVQSRVEAAVMAVEERVCQS